LDEQRELEEYQKSQLELKEKELEERLENERKGPGFRRSTSTTSTKNSQLKLLAGAVKRKGEKEVMVNKKHKDNPEEKPEKKSILPKPEKPSSVGLLGLADYGSDSDSDQSS
jgi:hypothetical protein